MGHRWTKGKTILKLQPYYDYTNIFDLDIGEIAFEARFLHGTLVTHTEPQL
jgi:hypothetical protein